MKQGLKMTEPLYLVVSKDGKGDFFSIQEAVEAVPEQCPCVIYVKKGIYKEVVWIPSSKPFMTIRGEDAFETVITFDNYAGKKSECGRVYGTSGSASLYVFADDFRAEHLTIENSFDYLEDVEGKQAVAAYTCGKRLVFKEVQFLGHQDTLYANTGTQYFDHCYIKGHVDFIFGAAQAVFEECVIESIDRGLQVNGYITAASTLVNKRYGYLFLKCKLISTAECNTVYLGRPWHPGGNPNAVANVVFMYCYLGSHIHLDGWTDMSGFKAKDARFYEYKNVGPGASVNASRKQLTDEDSRKYSKAYILDGWEPKR
ncbi:pectinesterase family protein [Halalkalibacter krulwichiae]|uniref:Pectinesterase A n=1 Tax=Halalkalibacter krulwichiae TaxID=199441 RepID=A0A1X9M7Z9_9BACI|nr:pectinesterase family protein [Halalkalibacter krulwichiae]ARK29536.1 Pectinesterase A precursor [Halalkalibacter krulwichiae]